MSRPYHDGLAHMSKYHNHQDHGHRPGSNSSSRIPGHLYAPAARSNGSYRGPPQRPRRPDDSLQCPIYLQPVLDQPRSSPHIVSASRQHHNTQSSSRHGNDLWHSDCYSYTPPNHPPPNRPPPNPEFRQAQSALSQYPRLQMPPQAIYARRNQRAPLSALPSTHRGPATYYPDVGYVNPTMEERDGMWSSVHVGSVRTDGHDSKTSFTGSNAIHIGVPKADLNNHDGSPPSTAEHVSIPEHYHAVSVVNDNAVDSPLDRSEHVVPPSSDQESAEAISRQASVGKKSRPRSTQSNDEVGSGSDQESASFPSQPTRGSASIDVQSITSETDRSRAHPEGEWKGTAKCNASNDEEHAVRDSSPIMSETVAALAMVRHKKSSGTRTPEEVLWSGSGLVGPLELSGAAITDEHRPQRQPRSPLALSEDDLVTSTLESLETGGAITPNDLEELKQPMGGLSERAGKRRPPRLDIDAVRDAQARASLTSLSDLIKRATKLASNLDRGKTASLLGMNWLDGTKDGEKRRSSVPDAPDSFIMPYDATLLGSCGELRRSITSGRSQNSTLPSDSDLGEPQNRKRRCCGMPLWLFILLTLLIMLLVVAAVVLPVVFVVLPKQYNNDNANPVGSCEKNLTCENGGANILSSNGHCECICRDGYSGRTCLNVAIQGCTTTSIGTTDNVTLGEAIPRLLEGSENNFSISLNGQGLLGLFSSSDMSCVSQNALVTFNNVASKRSWRDLFSVLARETTIQTLDGNGMIQATSSSVLSSSAAINISTTTLSIEDSAPDGTKNNATLDFARVAVLYVFQTSGDVNSAAIAQEILQSYFYSTQTNSNDHDNPSNLALGGNFTCNLTGRTIRAGTGAVVGGGPG